jgi:hypothetical protein
MKFRIEQLCRDYTVASRKEKKVIEADIQYYKNELQKSDKTQRKLELSNMLYNMNLMIPCVFNSGCAIGKRGITCIEIADGNITLVHWFDVNRSKKYFEHYEHHPERLGSTDYFRMVLKEDALDYIFTRIKLLG